MVKFKQYHTICERAKAESPHERPITADPEFVKEIEKAIETANKYTDKKIKDIEKKLDKIDTKGGGSKDESQYTVAGGSGDAYINVIDIKTGSVVTRIAPRGDIVTSPEVQGDLVSFTVQTSDGSRVGTVHKIPSGTLVSQFRVSGGKTLDIKGSEHKAEIEGEKDVAGLRGMKSGTGAVAPSDVVGGEDEPDPEPIVTSSDEELERIERERQMIRQQAVLSPEQEIERKKSLEIVPTFARPRPDKFPTK